MDVFDLYAKISLDTSGYDKGMAEASDKANNLKGELSGNLVPNGLDVAGKGFQSAGDNAGTFGSMLKANLVGSAIKIAIDALKKLGKVAVDTIKQSMAAFGEYEQYKGSVETIFKDSSDTILQYAQDAYKTTGMSANEFLEVVTNFSGAVMESAGRGAQTNLEEMQATLDQEYLETKRHLEDQYDIEKDYWDKKIKAADDSGYKEKLKDQRDEALKELKRSNEDQLTAIKEHNKSLIEEAEKQNETSVITSESTQRAAQATVDAVKDMSDIAAKYGKTTAEVSETYTSLARGNYQTLDNLFGGMFKGTKAGLEQMLHYAENYRAGLGETVSYSKDSYIDIMSAIHDVSESLGVAGSAADEAKSTITGSTGAMRAAWKNLIAGMSDDNADLDKLIQDFVEAASTAFYRLLPVAEKALKGLGKVVLKLTPFFFDLGLEIAKEILKGIISILLTPIRWLLGLLGVKGQEVHHSDFYNENEWIFNPDEHFKASGGRLNLNTPTIVGENGPELITSSRTGWVHNASETAGMLGGTTININGDVYDDERSMKRKLERVVLDVLQGQMAYG